MNVLVLNYEYPPLGGGGGVVCAEIAEELTALSHRVLVVTSAHGDLPRREVRRGVEIHRVPVLGRKRLAAASTVSLLSYPVAAFRTAQRLARAEPFDLVHSHFAVPTGPCSLAVARLARLPHVLSLHGGDVYDPTKSLSPHRVLPLRMTVDRVLSASTAVVATSSNIRDTVRTHYRYSGPIEIIPLGIRPPNPLPVRDHGVLRRLGLPSDAIVAITVGRLVRRKAIEALFGALVADPSERIHLLVCGSGPELDRLRAESQRQGIGQRVRFTGHISSEQKWRLLASSNMFVSSAVHEGFGLVFLEAMWAGLPVVCYDHGGQVDFLVEGETGFVVRAGDETRLSERINWLASHPNEARRMGSENEKRVRRYSIGECAAKYETLFERVIGGNGSPQRIAAR